MKRDMDLIRQILIQVEESEEADSDLTGVKIEVKDHSERVLFYHIRLLEQARLILINQESVNCDGEPHPSGLTWEGHEFLDGIRNEAIWNRIKKAAMEKTGSVSFEIVKFLALKFGRAALESMTGPL